MDKIKILKSLLIFLLLFSCGLDIYSTVSDKNFLVLEGNFVMNILDNIWSLVFFKILFCVGLSFILWFSSISTRSNFSKYFYIHMIILLIFLQSIAGVSNIMAKQQVTEFLNENTNASYSNPSEIPAEVIQEHVALPEQKATATYVGMIAKVFYIPFFLGLLSFWLWNLIFLVPSEEDGIWKEVKIEDDE